VRRPPTAALLCVVPAALSCAVLSTPPLEPPSVAAPSPPLAESAPILSPDPGQVDAIGKFLASRRTALTPHEMAQLAHTVVLESKRHDLDPWLVISLMAVESGFYNYAVSEAGALGLMQVMPATGEELAARLGVRWRGSRTLFDPVANVRLGVAYLRELSDRYGRLPVALAAYNWGPGRIDRRLRRGSPLPQEYSQLVLRSYDANQQRAKRS
jgi:soluble lytic murein transglycosylase-like protein